jgi:hypothetical protein
MAENYSTAHTRPNSLSRRQHKQVRLCKPVSNFQCPGGRGRVGEVTFLCSKAGRRRVTLDVSQVTTLALWGRIAGPARPGAWSTRSPTVSVALPRAGLLAVRPAEHRGWAAAGMEVVHGENHQARWPGRISRRTRPSARRTRPELPSLSGEIIAEIRGSIAEYARPLDGPYGQALRRGVEQALATFVDQIAEPPHHTTSATRCATALASQRRTKAGPWTACRPRTGSAPTSPGAGP